MLSRVGVKIGVEEVDMTIKQVARAAGVSPATVSRVMNSGANIAPSTAEAVRRVVAELQYNPRPRRRPGPRGESTSTRKARIGFFVVEHGLVSHNPAYERLMRGVSQANHEFDFEIQFSFVNADGDVVRRIADGGFDGLLLHGAPPDAEQSKPLHDIPTVWLMGGRQRPSWGDQVMPDNVLIGQIAAEHLLAQGHRDVIYFGIDTAWFYHARATAFQKAIEDAGGRCTIIQKSELVPGPIHEVGRATLARELFKKWKAMPIPATGLFVAEDWLLRPVYTAAADAGVAIGKDVSVVSCNNDRARLEGLSPVPPTVDIFIERIAARGVEQLAYRLKRPSDGQDRLRILVEPALVLP